MIPARVWLAIDTTCSAGLRQVLQTFALLGDRATERKRCQILSDPLSVRKEKWLILPRRTCELFFELRLACGGGLLLLAGVPNGANRQEVESL
jgi:hypothetical protein